MTEERNQLSSSEEERLIMFPASKNYPLESEGPIDDPLQDLLNEFADYTEADLPPHLRESSLEVASTYDTSQENLALRQNNSQGHYLEEQLKLLKETQERLNYYLNEIELYLGKNLKKH